MRKWWRKKVTSCKGKYFTIVSHLYSLTYLLYFHSFWCMLILLLPFLYYRRNYWMVPSSLRTQNGKEREGRAFVYPHGHINRQALFVLVECIYNYSKEKTTEMIVQSCCIMLLRYEGLHLWWVNGYLSPSHEWPQTCNKCIFF